MGAIFQGVRVSGMCSYKDDGMGWLLLRAFIASERDNERLSVINHEFKAECESQKPPWQDIKKTLISYSQRQRELRVRRGT